MIRQNLTKVLTEIERECLTSHREKDAIFVVVISKGRSVNEIMQAYEAGVRDFGENRVDEALEKMEACPKDIRWHFVGKLQKNKVSKVIGKFALIHSIDTFTIAKKISDKSLEQNVITSVLLESNTSGELSKSGETPEVWKKVFLELQNLKGISIQGLMTMAPKTEEESLIRHCFSSLRHLRDDLEDLANLPLPTLSMGMSNDFAIAIQEGSTLLRIGTLIFNPQ